MSTTFKQTGFSIYSKVNNTILEMIDENRENMTAFLSNAYSTLDEPYDSGKNIKNTCNNYYDEIVSTTGKDKEKAERELSAVYKSNSVAVDGTQMTDAYISEIMKLNVSTDSRSLELLQLIVGDAVLESIYKKGFNHCNGLNLLYRVHKDSGESYEAWVLALTFRLESESGYKDEVDNAINDNDSIALKSLLQLVDTQNQVAPSSFVDNLAKNLFSGMNQTFSDSQIMSMTTYIGNVSYDLLW
ncbi:hypothetical protein [Photobacterium rosenbergii]|uniref:Uncharacterized protein n=1 Tax=Photobacterium rosenbergii TaxID=294936 RepID=A0ABU3ZCG8_9GAMM|nr:hypothetical protein [Photobacterium rosenbergii]MDV5167809.1 hypothetical protein [Photobacterium rosenbergii]